MAAIRKNPFLDQVDDTILSKKLFHCVRRHDISKSALIASLVPSEPGYEVSLTAYSFSVSYTFNLSIMIVIADDDEKVICEILDIVNPLTASYYKFGLGLGILANKLDKIRTENTGGQTNDAVQHLLEVVRYRLRQEEPSTWATFAAAVEKAQINKRLANSMDHN